MKRRYQALMTMIRLEKSFNSNLSRSYYAYAKI